VFVPFDHSIPSDFFEAIRGSFNTQLSFERASISIDLRVSQRYNRPMQASVILAHPYPKSFNHALFDRLCSVLDNRGVGVFSHDLYEENFNPVLTVQEAGVQTFRRSSRQYIRGRINRVYVCILYPSQLVGTASSDSKGVHRQGD